jgi:4-oxalocrotonate tautomerase family enzyme
MPTVTVSGPVIDVECKRKLADGLTKVAADAYRMPRDAIIVLIQEVPAENVGIGGCLLCDRKRQP